MNGLQDIFQQIAHENRMKEFAEGYYNLKMQAGSLSNVVLGTTTNISNLDVLTLLKPFLTIVIHMNIYPEV